MALFGVCSEFEAASTCQDGIEDWNERDPSQNGVCNWVSGVGGRSLPGTSQLTRRRGCHGTGSGIGVRCHNPAIQIEIFRCLRKPREVGEQRVWNGRESKQRLDVMSALLGLLQAVDYVCNAVLGGL